AFASAHWLILTLLIRVAVRNFNVISVLAHMFRDCVCDENRSMPAARTADGNRNVRLSFPFVLRQQKIHEAIDMVEELMRRLMRVHVSQDRETSAGWWLEEGKKIRMHKKKNTKHQIRIDGPTLLKPTADEQKEKGRGPPFLEQPHGMLAQFVNRKPG